MHARAAGLPLAPPAPNHYDTLMVMAAQAEMGIASPESPVPGIPGIPTHVYPLSETVTDEQLAQVRLTPSTFHGQWNYTVDPH